MISSVSYLPFGPVEDYVVGDNVLTLDRTYNERYQLSRISTSNGTLDHQYQYYANGNVWQIDGLAEPGVLDKVTDYTLAAGSNGLFSAVTDSQTILYTLDNQGNIIAANLRTFEYNQDNRLVSVVEDGTILAEFSYDGYGRRVKKSAAGVDTYYYYDKDNHLISEMAFDGQAMTPLKDYVYLADEPVAMKVYNGAQAGIYYYLNDHLGTPQKLVDGTGSVVWEAAYLPFGQAQVAGTSTVVNNLRFPGQYFDEETGLHYNWHRYYDPSTGRYMTPDPIGLDGGINLYSYANQNPINITDPEGLFAWGIPAYEAIKWGGAALIAAMGAKAAKETADAINKASSDNEQCKTNRCKPCIPPVGTIATDVHQVPPGKPHFPIEGSHVHWFKMNQSPYPECRCFWKRNYKKPTPGDTTPAGTVPVTPAAGGGPM